MAYYNFDYFCTILIYIFCSSLCSDHNLYVMFSLRYNRGGLDNCRPPEIRLGCDIEIIEIIEK